MAKKRARSRLLAFVLDLLFIWFIYMGDFTQPHQKYAGTGENCISVITVIFDPVHIKRDTWKNVYTVTQDPWMHGKPNFHLRDPSEVTLLFSYLTKSCKKIFCVQYPDFQLKNVRIMYLVNFGTVWGIKVKIYACFLFFL